MPHARPSTVSEVHAVLPGALLSRNFLATQTAFHQKVRENGIKHKKNKVTQRIKT
jgi:hypothetical protein